MLERHPGLRLVSVDHEAAWVPNWLQRMDWHYRNPERHSPEFRRFSDGALPSDLARQGVYISFSEDRAAVAMRDVLGADHLLWGSDYPHPESTFTKSDELLTGMLADVSDDEVEKLIRRNTQDLYGIEAAAHSRSQRRPLRRRRCATDGKGPLVAPELQVSFRMFP